MLYASIVLFVSIVVQSRTREPIINRNDRIEHSAKRPFQRAARSSMRSKSHVQGSKFLTNLRYIFKL